MRIRAVGLIGLGLAGLVACTAKDDDENVVISQFHLAILRFHNAVADRLRGDPAQAQRSARDLFEEARRQVQWHYQWIILHEYSGDFELTDLLRFAGVVHPLN